MSELGRFRKQPHTRAQGGDAEDTAVRWLGDHGYRIVERNVVTKAGEIDLVAEHGNTLCFIEVKARATTRYGSAIEAVDARKQRRIARAASLYLVSKPYDGPCRFDVVGLDPGPDGWHVTLVQDAFRL